jgi:lysophospholipase L1-like esterase
LDYVLRTLLLSPVLVPQALWVRARTPLLPEPEGQRRGEAGLGPDLRLLIVGDSAAAGVGASHQDEALLGQLLIQLTPTFRVSWDLRATTGHKTADAIEVVENMEPARFDVAVTSLGVNDVTGLVKRKLWLEQQARLRELLRRKLGVNRILVSGLPPMHQFPALPQPLRAHVGAEATRFNEDLRSGIAGDEIARFVDIRFTEDRALMSEDGFHPGPAVYATWAERIATAILADFEANGAS